MRYFEINVTSQYNMNLLQRFLQTALRRYRYVVVAINGIGLDCSPQ
ncbi:hypothetical protein NDI44_27495 [Trichocoleus sp. DQ-A3]|nr:hypothetical protein [Coleofasciculus sp. FACHB-125]MBD1903618.1 hypothetical protein [Coleofasciculus sp. FACHB-125]